MAIRSKLKAIKTIGKTTRILKTPEMHGFADRASQKVLSNPEKSDEIITETFFKVMLFNAKNLSLVPCKSKA